MNEVPRILKEEIESNMRRLGCAVVFSVSAEESDFFCRQLLKSASSGLKTVFPMELGETLNSAAMKCRDTMEITAVDVGKTVKKWS